MTRPSRCGCTVPRRREGLAARHRHDPRRRLRHRLLRHGQPVARPLVSRPRRGRRLRRVPPRTRDAVPGTARGLLRRLALDLRQRRRTRHRQGPHRPLRAERRRRAGCRAGVARPRPRRGARWPSCCSTAPCSTTASRRPPSRPTASTCGEPGSNEFGWRSYLGELYGSDEVPSYAAAARAADLAGLPPTCVVVGSIDGFRDEDIDYAQRLNQAGVPCELHVIAGLPHAYLLVPGAAAVQLAMHCMDDWVTRQLAGPPPA